MMRNGFHPTDSAAGTWSGQLHGQLRGLHEASIAEIAAVPEFDASAVGVTTLDAPPIRMVCFDIGGVLVRHCRSWDEGVAAAGLDPRHEPAEAHAERMQAAFMLLCGFLDAAQFAQAAAAAPGSAFNADEIAAIHEAWLGEQYEGVEDVLDALLATGRVDTGVLSNIDAAHWRRVQANAGPRGLRAPAMLSKRFASYELGLAKPMPGIYAEFERRTGYQGAEVLFLDDLEENVRAARTHGWTAERIDWSRPTAPQIAQALAKHGLL